MTAGTKTKSQIIAMAAAVAAMTTLSVLVTPLTLEATEMAMLQWTGDMKRCPVMIVFPAMTNARTKCGRDVLQERKIYTVLL